MVLAACLALCGCAVSSPGQQSSTKWTTGFWLWRGASSRAEASGPPIDVLFLQVGTIQEGYAQGELPENIPEAKEYWLVFRYERQAVPRTETAPQLAAEVSRLLRIAREEKLNVAGVQLDIDSPTGRLATYADFLRVFKKSLPPDCRLSITALLDWFRSGTDVSQVIRIVDEFVPQFYDIAADGYRGETAIASRIDAARWGPVFNGFGKPFRLGISSFGRAQMVRKQVPAAPRHSRIEIFDDLRPLDIATNAGFHLEASRNQANEVVLEYTAQQKTKIGYTNFNRGDGIQFVLATPESIRIALDSARQIKGNLAGVVFFRWPGDGETLVMQPEEVLAAAGLARDRPAPNRIDLIDGHCAAVDCEDVYLKSASPFASAAVRYRIHASTELEYFLPEKNLPVRLTAPAELELSLPPYCARGRLYLGRAVSLRHAAFTVEEEQ
jgi:hypothetical protein